MKERWKAPLAAFILPAFPHILLLLMGRVYFFADLLLQYLPWQELMRKEFLSGCFPIWDPYSFCGYSFVGNFQSALFYPPKLLSLLLPSTLALHLLLALHYGWAGLGTYLLVRSCGGSPVGGLAGAVIFGLSGKMVAQHLHLTIVFVSSWGPWILLGLKESCERKSVWPSFPPLLMALLAGHPETFLNLALLSIPWTVHCVRGRWGSLKWPLLGAFFALLLSMPQNLAGLESFFNSERWMAIKGEFKGKSPLCFRHLPLFFFPRLLGNYAWNMGPPLWWEYCGFVGLLPLIALFFGDRKGFFFWVALLSLLLSFLPLSELRLTRFASRWLIWWSLFVALHVGANIERKVSALWKARRVLLLTFLLFMACATALWATGLGGQVILKLFFFHVTEEVRGQLIEVMSWYWAMFILWWAIFGGAIFFFLSKRHSTAVSMCVAVIVCELTIFSLQANPTISTGELEKCFRAPPQPKGRVLPLAGGESVLDCAKACFPNLHLLGPTYSAIGNDPMRPRFVGFVNGQLDKCGVSLVIKGSSEGVVYTRVENAVWPPIVEVEGRGGLGLPLRLEEGWLRDELVYFKTWEGWRGGRVAVSVTAFPGWKGFVDKEAKEVRGLTFPPKARLLSIQVPKGAREVWMVYHPGSLVAGLFVGLLGLAPISGLWVALSKGERR